MKRALLLILSLLAWTSLSFTAESPTQKGIYGPDDRKDYFEVNNPLFLKLANSTAAMIADKKLFAEGLMTLVKGTTLKEQGVCSNERFSNQIASARCSGFLVGKDLLVTAGHCVKTLSDCEDYSWVFDYAFKKKTKNMAEIRVPSTSIYKCQDILERNFDTLSGVDYSLIRLKAEVLDRAPLRVRKEGTIKKGEKVLVIGSPAGLPAKISAGAWVRDNQSKEFFVTNLDTFVGNSGSAVFNAKTAEVEGILARGGQDYTLDQARNCRSLKRCPDEGCRGEDVVRITNIERLTQEQKLMQERR